MLSGKGLADAVEVAVAITNLSSEGVRESGFSQSSGSTYIQEGWSCTGRIEIKGMPAAQGTPGTIIGALMGAVLYRPCLGCLGLTPVWR